jgi:hypothetical protein
MTILLVLSVLQVGGPKVNLVKADSDTEPPVITIYSPVDGSTVNTSTITFTGKVTDNVGVTMVEIYVRDYHGTRWEGGLLPNSDGTFKMEIILSLGTNIFTFTAFDAAGNKAEKTITITLSFDFEAPVITIYSPVDGSTVNTPTVIVKGKVTDNCGVASLWIDTTKIDFAPDGSFSQKIELIEGTNTIKVVAYDAVGNKSEKDLTVTYNKIFTINASAGLGGLISPSGTTAVNSGESKTFTITPDKGYKISDVKVDGKPVGAVSTYTFTNVTDNHTIEATFEKSETVIILQIGQTSFTVNGVPNTLDSPPIIKNGRTLLPIRVVIEALDGTVG